MPKKRRHSKQKTPDPPKTRPPSRLTIWLIVIALCAITITVISKKSAQGNDLVTATPSASADPTRDWGKASLALEKLVKTHPHKDVRVKFNKLIEDNVVFLNFQENLAMGGEGLATVTWIRTPTHGIVLTFSVGVSDLLGKRDSRTFKQLVLYHEYIHVDQQLSGRYPKRLAFGRRSDVPFSEKEIRIHFASEVEAYEAECKLAIKIDAAHELDLCQAYASGGLRKMKILLAARLSRLTMFNIHGHGPFLKRLARE